MKRIEITINDKAYPCSPTMGAMLRFRQETGREINEIEPTSFSDLCTVEFYGRTYAISAGAESADGVAGEKKRKRRQVSTTS